MREWLQDLLPAQHAVEVRKGYLPFTKNRLRAEKRTKASSKNGAQLDPDAPVRGACHLDVEDVNYDKALVRNLFEYARAGQLASALDLCAQTSQAWRAASLRGAIFYHDPVLADDDGVVTKALGNRTRQTWRRTAWHAAQDTRLDPYERALYGALCGELQSVLAVSETWEERLWAYVNARFERLLDRALTSVSPNWWQSQYAAGDDGAGGGDSDALDDVFERLAQTHAVNAQAADPFHMAQRAVISKSLPALLERVAQRLPELRTSEPQEYVRLVRFFAHLVLYCRAVHVDLPESAAAVILESYVGVLQESEQSAELIALYASSLASSDAHTSYAHFLRTLDINAPIAERRHALLQAASHEFDAATTARMVVSGELAELLPVVRDAHDERDWDSAPTATERRLAHAIDWLTFTEDTYVAALLQTNVLMRLFMARGRVSAAHYLLQRLPSELLSSIAELDVAANEVLELDHWRTYFDVLDKNVAMRGLFADGALSSASHAQHHDWVETLRNAVDSARHAALELLEVDWLNFDIDTSTDAGAARAHELQIVRRRYIPEIVLQLHVMLVETSAAIPGNLAHALALPNLIADERLKLYKTFNALNGENVLGAYLEHVREAALLAMDRRQDVLGAQPAAAYV